jgi:NADH-quinone oxidoreductase subunit G
VGALTLKEFRFKTRVWYLKNTPTVCAGCARGCNIVAGVGQQQTMMTTSGQIDDRIKRLVPRVNEEVNGHWMCDEGRLSYQRENDAERVVTTRIAATAESYDETVAAAAARLAKAAKAGKLGAIVSPRLVAEDMYAWRSLLEALGGASFGVRALKRGEDDALLIRADKGANSRGAQWIFGADATEASVRTAVAAGRISTLLVLGDTLDPADTPAAVVGLSGRIETVFIGPFLSGAAHQADVAIPSASWSEADGTFVNFQGRAQRVRRCHLPMGEARPGWRIAMDVAAAAGTPVPSWTAAEDVLAALGRSVKEFSGISFESLGLLGVGAPAPTSA